MIHIVKPAESIQEVVNKAHSGDTVKLLKGAYCLNDNLILRDVKLEGQ